MAGGQLEGSGATVEAYLASLVPERREALEQLRALVHALIPEAHEEIQHGMPFYTLPQQADDTRAMVCALASQKRHMAL